MIKEILRLCLLKKKSRCFRERADVILKTIFRSFRKFFDFKFEGLMKKRKEPEASYLALVEDFVRQEFPEAELDPDTCQALSNHMVALIYPKELKRDIEGSAGMEGPIARRY